ncbi:ABC transporter ATP-binding protein [Geodermatophilus aquaeductus]|uniref:ABC transporter ATP-binding protein n=1 Tax=Geodermatophilus aquaeductus TaxID=1564161 RepID=UPI003CCC5409
MTDLHVAYGKIEAVRGVGLSVDQGKITLVLGANGAGKSTTLKAIAGMVPAQRGSVVLDGAEVLGQAPHRLVRRGLALVPEGRRVFGPLTVAENLRMGGYTAGKKVLEQTLDRVYDTFPILAERRNGAAGLLSGGEQQMLAFGRALMSQPKVMLMDEPSMGLAPVVVDSILAGVRQMADDGIGILMVEQNAEAGLDLADDVVAVARGEVVYTGASGDARNHASVLRAFLGEAALAGKGA